MNGNYPNFIVNFPFQFYFWRIILISVVCVLVFLYFNLSFFCFQLIIRFLKFYIVCDFTTSLCPLFGPCFPFLKLVLKFWPTMSIKTTSTRAKNPRPFILVIHTPIRTKDAHASSRKVTNQQSVFVGRNRRPILANNGLEANEMEV